MEQRRFGSTDLITSPIGFGTWEMSGTMYGDIDVAAASRAVGAAIDHGITLFDTAAVYGPFHSERLLAKARGARRREVTLVTKVERLATRNAGGATGRAARLAARPPSGRRRAVLQRLATDVIDLLLIHHRATKRWTGATGSGRATAVTSTPSGRRRAVCSGSPPT